LQEACGGFAANVFLQNKSVSMFSYSRFIFLLGIARMKFAAKPLLYYSKKLFCLNKWVLAAFTVGHFL